MSTPSKPTGPSRKGKRDGVVTELSCFFKIKPGRAEHIRQMAKALDAAHTTFERLGKLTEGRLVVFDDDRQLGLFTVFEGDWDPYIEDFVPGGGGGVISGLDKVFRDNVEGYLTKPMVEITAEDVKNVIDAHQVSASGFVWMHSAHTLKQIRKALQLNDAFQKVLDNPEAAKALEHPALQPLLAEAAD